MKRNFWMTLAILLAFLLMIQLIYSSWFSGKGSKPAVQKIENVEQDLKGIIKRLEQTGASIDEAIVNIESGKADIARLRDEVNQADADYRNSLKQAGEQLDSMGRAFGNDRKMIEDLRNELIKLK